MKRLLLTCTDLMAVQFLVPHVKYLSEHGFSVELACSQVGGRLEELRGVLDGIAPESDTAAGRRQGKSFFSWYFSSPPIKINPSSDVSNILLLFTFVNQWQTRRRSLSFRQILHSRGSTRNWSADSGR